MLESENKKRPGQCLRGNCELFIGAMGERKIKCKRLDWGRKTVKRPPDAVSCQDHHNAHTKIKQRTDVK